MTRIGVFTWYAPAPGGGERYVFGAAEALRDLGEVDLLCPRPFDPAPIAEALGLDLRGMRMVPHPWRRLHGFRDLFRRRRYDLFFALSNHLAPFQMSLGRRGILHLQCPPYPPPFHTPRRSRWKLRTYDRIVANSHFTASWALRHGTAGLPVQVVHPPIDVERFRAGEKERWIVSVGRFFVGRHQKNQQVLLEAFRLLVASGVSGWELHLAGAVRRSNPEDVAFLEALRRAAVGLPVRFHVDAPLERIVDLYARGAIYWHGAGYGVDPEAEPQRVEHFGMSIVEAMAAGAVPIVVPVGGPLEIVDEGRTGYFWRTPEELARITRSSIEAHPASLRAITGAASASAARFSKQRFAEQIRAIGQELLGS